MSSTWPSRTSTGIRAARGGRRLEFFSADHYLWRPQLRHRLPGSYIRYSAAWPRWASVGCEWAGTRPLPFRSTLPVVASLCRFRVGSLLRLCTGLNHGRNQLVTFLQFDWRRNTVRRVTAGTDVSTRPTSSTTPPRAVISTSQSPRLVSAVRVYGSAVRCWGQPPDR